MEIEEQRSLLQQIGQGKRIDAKIKAIRAEVDRNGLRCWTDSPYDSYGYPLLKDALKDSQTPCPVCDGKKEICFSSCCMPKIQPCPRCCKHPSILSRQIKGHTQIVHYVGGQKQTIRNIQEHWENEMVHVIDGTGKEWIINKANVLSVEVIP